MSFNAATLRLMAEKGLTALDIAELAEAMEGNARSPAAVRQQRYRDNKRNERDVTRDVTPPPKENIKPPGSVSDETGGEPPDPVKLIFDIGVSLLTASGKTEREARTIVGSWRKGRNDSDVAAALLDCKAKSITNPVEWMPKRLNGKPGEGGDYLQHMIARKELERQPTAAGSH